MKWAIIKKINSLGLNYSYSRLQYEFLWAGMGRKRWFLFISYRTKHVYSSPKLRNTELEQSGRVFNHTHYILLFFQI